LKACEASAGKAEVREKQERLGIYPLRKGKGDGKRGRADWIKKKEKFFGKHATIEELV